MIDGQPQQLRAVEERERMLYNGWRQVMSNVNRIVAYIHCAESHSSRTSSLAKSYYT